MHDWSISFSMWLALLVTSNLTNAMTHLYMPNIFIFPVLYNSFLLASPEFSVGFVNDQVSVSESNSSVTLNIVSTPAARPVEITVITQDIIGGVRPATADIGKIFITQ